MLFEDTARNRRIGIAFISLSTLCFAGLDACAKWLIQSLPVLEVVWLRFVLHTLITPLLLGPVHGRTLATVLALGDTPLAPADAARIFPDYLAAAEALAWYVDAWK